MRTAQTGTIVGYGIESGEQLFIHVNRVTTFADGTSALPCSRDIYCADGKQYLVEGIRRESTALIYKMDLALLPKNN
jgi:hypothetical protein